MARGRYRLLLPLIALITLALVQTIPLGWLIGGEVEMWRALSADPYETRRFALKLLALTLAGLLLLRYTSNQRRFRTLVHVVIGVGVASASLAHKTYGQENVPTSSYPVGSGRSYAQFIDRNHFVSHRDGTWLGLANVGKGLQLDRRLLYLTAAYSCVHRSYCQTRAAASCHACQYFLLPCLSRGSSVANIPNSDIIVRGWCGGSRSFIVALESSPAW